MFLHDKIFDTKEKILKKKNSEIENRLFDKTRYYVIAVGKRPLSSVGKKNINNDEDYVKIRAYIYYDGHICFYSTQGKAYNKREYINYIDFVKQAIHKNLYEWTNFWVNRGQIITKDSRNNIIVDNELITPLGDRPRVRTGVSDFTLQVYVDSLKSIYKNDDLKVKDLEQSFENGSLKKDIHKKIKNLNKKQINDIDGEIIVRTRIEGYDYITSYVKIILNTNLTDKINIIEDFYERIFFLEVNGYIFNYLD